jgi:hypothetical protein
VTAKASDFNKPQQLSTSDSQQVQCQPVTNIKFQWVSIDPGNLVRDQGVGGSNPLSPTIYFQQQLPNFELRQISAEGKSVTLACFPNICQQ